MGTRFPSTRFASCLKDFPRSPKNRNAERPESVNPACVVAVCVTILFRTHTSKHGLRTFQYTLCHTPGCSRPRAFSLRRLLHSSWPDRVMPVPALGSFFDVGRRDRGHGPTDLSVRVEQNVDERY
jgi:hypothetical protein